jgi:hypothetical protein
MSYDDEEDIKCEMCSKIATFKVKSKVTKDWSNLCGMHKDKYGYGEAIKLKAIIPYKVSGTVEKNISIVVDARTEKEAINKALKSEYDNWDEDYSNESTSEIKNIKVKEDAEDEDA